MQFKIATGSNPFNLLYGAVQQSVGPISATGAPKTAMVSYTPGPPSLLTVASSVAIGVSGNGEYIVADLDYLTTQTGLVGAAGIPVQPGQVIDVDYTRKASDFVARCTSVATNVLTLDQPFVGGGSGLSLPAPTSPPAGSNVQRISGWASREGGTFISEWSGLLVLDTIDSAQIAVYYPHIAISQFRDVAAWTIENVGTTDETGYELDCMMEAMAFDDPLDGETVVGYKAFYPRPNQNIAI